MKRSLRALGLLALALFFSWAALRRTPLDVLPVSAYGDANTHTEILLAAAEAQDEGQWPLREAPRVAGVSDPVFRRYPLFQFYSVAPYALGARLKRAGLTGYAALLAVTLLSFVAGFLGLVGLARHEGWGWDAALAGALLFTLAPYHLTDWYGRYAFAEVAAFGLLPGLCWASFRAGDRGRPADLCWAALAWVAMILTHNIFHLYALVFMAALALGQAWRGKEAALFWRPALAYGLAALACAWFLVPVGLNAPHFLIMDTAGSPFANARFAPWWVLLSPVRSATAEVKILAPDLGLQVGALLLLAAVLQLGFRREPALGRRRPRAYGAFFWLSLFMAWSPLDLWPLLGPLKIVQFPYRLLVFCALFGSLLAAELWERQVASRLSPRARALALILLAAAALIAADPYIRARRTAWPPALVDRAYAEGGVNLRTGLVYLYGYPSTDADGHRSRAIEMEKPGGPPLTGAVEPGLTTRVVADDLREPGTLLLPSPWYPGLYRLRVNGQEQAYERSSVRHKNRLAVKVPAGTVEVDYRFSGLAWANTLSALGAVLLGLLALFSLYQWLAGKKPAV